MLREEGLRANTPMAAKDLSEAGEGEREGEILRRDLNYKRRFLERKIEGKDKGNYLGGKICLLW